MSLKSNANICAIVVSKDTLLFKNLTFTACYNKYTSQVGKYEDTMSTDTVGLCSFNMLSVTTLPYILQFLVAEATELDPPVGNDMRFQIKV